MGTIECPVCTLYLRADMSLETHLSTHPPDQVIKALVSLATKPTTPSAPASVSAPTIAAPPAPAPVPMTPMDIIAGSSRSRTPPNALMYHSSGYEPIKQAAPPPPPPPPAPIPQLQHSSLPTAIAVVKASDMGYHHPLNNVMIVKSCSTKFMQQLTPANAATIATGGIANPGYTTGTIDSRSLFIEPDRGGPAAAAAIAGRKQMAPSMYPRYTNERYSGPPPPYSTAISSTISSSSQLQQSSITSYTSRYAEQKPNLANQTFVQNPSATVVHNAPTINITQQQVYHAPYPPMNAATLQQQIQPTIALAHSTHELQPSTSLKSAHAQYTEKEDGNFTVTENPKKIVEYTENDEGDFMVIEKVVKSPPRVIKVNDISYTIEEETEDDREEDIQHSTSHDGQNTGVEEEQEVEQEEYEIMVDEDVPTKPDNTSVEQSKDDTIEIVENDDGTFDDNCRSTMSGMPEMPKPMLIGTIGSKKSNKFNLIVDSSPSTSGSAVNSPSTPRKRPASGLKVLSNVKVTTDLSQGIKDIILNLNCKNKTSNLNSTSSSTSNTDAIKTSMITEIKPAAVVNNNCQNELIFNSGSNMPPIDLNNINDIEIINDDEEDVRSDEEKECYVVGSLELKASDCSATLKQTEELSSNATQQCVVPSSSRGAPPTPSVITSVIRMTPHSSPVIAESTPMTTQMSQQTVSAETNPPKETVFEVTTKVEPTSESVVKSSPVLSGSLLAVRKPQSQVPTCSTTPLFNRPPKKLNLKLKTPLPPIAPPTPPLVAHSAGFDNFADPKIPKVEQISVEERSELTADKPFDFSTGDGSIPMDCETSHLQPVNLSFDEAKCSATEPNSSTALASLCDEETETKPIKPDLEEQPCSSEAVTSSLLIQAHLDHNLQHSETTVVYTTRPASSASGSSRGSEHNFSKDASVHETADDMNQEVVQTTTTTTTSTTAVEYYNITIIDEQHSTCQIAEVSDHESESIASPGDNEVKSEVDLDNRTNIAEQYEIKIMNDNVYTSFQESQIETEAGPSNSSEVDRKYTPLSKDCIKVEKVDNIDKIEVEESELQNRPNEDDKLEFELPITKIEQTVATASSELRASTISNANNFDRDHKDFLEAGPSGDNVKDSVGTTAENNHNSRNRASEHTYLDYSTEYDDYVQVGGYGAPPPEQIPLSWVQKFSPQYAPFEDQNSYMDLDMCSSKNNSNSVGGNSAVSSSSCTNNSGSASNSVSRVDSSMDRAPSAESLNIRTDEKMPAKGEISEQESNGDMELSWNRLYPVHENIPIYPISYDLSTAQECWNLSNRNTEVGTYSAAAASSQTHISGSSSGSNQVNQHYSQAHQQQQPQLSQSQGLNFQFSQSDHQRIALDADDDDEALDDKSKIRLDYDPGMNASGSSYLGLEPNSRGTKLMHDRIDRKLVKIRNYRCTECPETFALLKQRRIHMKMEHMIDTKVSSLMPTAATSTSIATSTVTSGAAMEFFNPTGEGPSNSLLNKKVKIEPVPMLMSYSSLKLELEQKQEYQETGVAIPGPSGLPAGPSTSTMEVGEIRRKRTYVCGTCKQEFDRFKLFNAHLMVHPVECYTCGRNFKHWPNFALHIKRHLGIKDHQCRLCGKKFVIKQKLIEHMRVHTGKAPIKCPDCDQHFRRFSNLAQHRNRHHLNKVASKKDFVCHCGEVFQSKAKMEWHKEIHENKPKSCPFCREKFIHKNSLTRHIRLSHTEKYVKLEAATEMCPICHQPYIKTSMKRHMETHTEARMAFSCPICNKLFSTNWNLKQHKWTHANPTLKPFQCNMCSSGFVREADYITHMNSHKSIRPYTCNHCGCQFIRKYNWIRHTREHETDKNYTCEICGRKFHRKYYLTEHKRIHTGERPFSCNICGKTSSTKTNHNKHIKIHHARDPLTAEG
ncbi:uncharacterized protein LOC129760371 [Uranotaenia lowii]|uniref:uncharacterized protein LOC129760371 n=1 Tax=Uranotaenia lowii TaxID=190385 RepID=UPI002479D180|nr:uncharacterized protein LOC129760371 [Uranotaenia lowii]